MEKKAAEGIEVELELPDEVIAQLNEIAAEQGITVDEVANKILKNYIAEEEYIESYRDNDV